MTAHNGYLEIYVNLGWLGVCLFVAALLASFGKIQRTLVSDYEFGRMKLGFWIIAILYNVTESAFKGVSPVWLMFLLVSIELPRSPKAVTEVMSKFTAQDSQILGVR